MINSHATSRWDRPDMSQIQARPSSGWMKMTSCLVSFVKRYSVLSRFQIVQCITTQASLCEKNRDFLLFIQS